jgi:hypothetical protein
VLVAVETLKRSSGRDRLADASDLVHIIFFTTTLVPLLHD